MKQYRYYLFDIDRTLWAFDANARRAIDHTLDLMGLTGRLGIEDKNEFFEKYQSINQALWIRYERGEITKEFLRDERFYRMFKEFYGIDDRPLGLRFGNAYLDRMPVETELEPDAENVLKTLKGRGCKIACVSNGFKEVQYRKLENSGILHYVDAMIISEEVGSHKPAPKIFRTALERISGRTGTDEIRRIKSETLMVGDDFANDIEGAQIFGIDQFYYNPHRRPCDGGPTYESDSLADLIR